MKAHIPNLEMSDLLFIANQLQYLVKKPTNLKSWEDVQQHGGDQLTTAVLGINEVITAQALFDLKGSDAAIEKINETITILIQSILNLNPELLLALRRSTEELCKTNKQLKEYDHFLETLGLIRDGTVRLIDRLDEKAPKSTQGANNHRTDYIVQYAAIYYHDIMKKWPITDKGNSNNRIRNVLSQIHKRYSIEGMGGHIDRANKIVGVLASGTHKLPAPKL